MEKLYTFGPNKELLFQSPENYNIIKNNPHTIILENRENYYNVNSQNINMPLHIKGKIIDSFDESPTELAIALNNKIVAVTRTYKNVEGTGNFTALIPEDEFSDGFNDVVIYIVENKNGEYTLLSTEADVQTKTLDYGQIITFGKDGNADKYTIEGLSFP